MLGIVDLVVELNARLHRPIRAGIPQYVDQLLLLLPVNVDLGSAIVRPRDERT